MKLPLIDLSNLGENDSPRWESTKIQIREALQEYGCFEANFNNNIPLELRKSVGEGIRQLFDLPLAIKLLNKNPHKPLHSYVGRNDTDGLVESVAIDGALSSHVVDTFANLMWPNQGNPTFSKDILLYCEKMSELDKIVRRIVLESFGLEKYIDEHFNSTDYVCRINKYEAPRTPHSMLGLFSHTDKNFISTLHRSIMLTAWTNGRLHDPTHKVVVSGDETRYMIGLFTVAKEGCVIKTPEELVDEDHPLLYNPFDYYKFNKFTTTDAGRALPDPLKEYCGA
ncbi:hypothetical protein SASPL_141628 [Salvia splendens]|uniref:Non-haem dioxygenase N-terminal domain-containing protein n=1 Tax=Salvia splendens TaxID=180675 RepID=A0A8X8WQW8_SALSN|nr:hypothetical protein SASPL_141628 [Salvia splendens]